MTDIVEEAKHWRRDMQPFEAHQDTLTRLIAEVVKLRSDKQYADNFDLHAEIAILQAEVERLTHVEEECKLALKAESKLKAEVVKLRARRVPMDEQDKEANRIIRNAVISLKAEVKRLQEETYKAPVGGWTCYHCGVTFKKPGAMSDAEGS